MAVANSSGPGAAGSTSPSRIRRESIAGLMPTAAASCSRESHISPAEGALTIDARSVVRDRVAMPTIRPPAGRPARRRHVGAPRRLPAPPDSVVPAPRCAPRRRDHRGCRRPGEARGPETKAPAALCAGGTVRVTGPSGVSTLTSAPSTVCQGQSGNPCRCRRRPRDSVGGRPSAGGGRGLPAAAVQRRGPLAGQPQDNAVARAERDLDIDGPALGELDPTLPPRRRSFQGHRKLASMSARAW